MSDCVANMVPMCCFKEEPADLSNWKHPGSHVAFTAKAP